jgi:hypothetical protein
VVDLTRSKLGSGTVGRSAAVSRITAAAPGWVEVWAVPPASERHPEVAPPELATPASGEARPSPDRPRLDPTASRRLHTVC